MYHLAQRLLPYQKYKISLKFSKKFQKLQLYSHFHSPEGVQFLPEHRTDRKHGVRESLVAQLNADS